MATIIYQFADGHVETIEVSEEMYEAYTKIDKAFNRNEEKHAWRQRKREASFEKLCEEKGFDIVDTAPSIEEQASLVFKTDDSGGGKKGGDLKN